MSTSFVQLTDDDVYYQESYISIEHAKKIKNYFDVTINDNFSNGPKPQNKFTHNFTGCQDRPLRLENSDNPLHVVIDKLKQDFGDFYLHTGSIRYMNYPFGPHTDIRTQEWLLEQRKNYNDGHIFIIPLWWEKNYTAGTAFFSSPPSQNEPLYIEHQSILPQAVDDREIRNFSVKRLLYWKNPGDLIVWKNYTWHSSFAPNGYNYSHDKFCKEFISIETWGILDA